MEVEYTRVNNSRFPLILGKIQVHEKSISFKLDKNYKNICIALTDDTGTNISGTVNLDFKRGAVNRGSPTILDRNGSRATKTAYIFDEVADGIYLRIEMRAKSDSKLTPVTLFEGIVINKFEWLILKKRFQKHAEVTIANILKDMKINRCSISHFIKDTQITPLSSISGKKRVSVKNDMNPDGFVLIEDGNIEEKSIMDIVETWSERDQDLFMLRNFTSL